MAISEKRRSSLIHLPIALALVLYPVSLRAGTFTVRDAAPYAGITASRLWHDSDKLSAGSNGGMRIGVDAAVGRLGRLGADMGMEVTAADGELVGVPGGGVWGISWAWVGFAYRSPGRAYGVFRGGFSRAWFSATAPGKHHRISDDGGIWSLGAGARIVADLHVEIEYEKVALLRVDTPDEAIRAVRLTLWYRRSIPR